MTSKGKEHKSHWIRNSFLRAGAVALADVVLVSQTGDTGARIGEVVAGVVLTGGTLGLGLTFGAVRSAVRHTEEITTGVSGAIAEGGKAVVNEVLNRRRDNAPRDVEL